MDDHSDDDAAAMAEAMGFSSFGAKHPNKRRKFNPGADAVVSVSTSTHTVHRHHNQPSSTGSNKTPLGVRKPKFGDEIDLDDVEDGGDDAAVGELGDDVGKQPDGDDDDEDPEPQYIDTSRPSTIDNVQSHIDAIIGSSLPASLPSRPPAPVREEMLANRGGGHDRGGRHQSQSHETRHDKWWEDYYDPAFITNPWEKIEKSMGVEPRGPWPSWDEAKIAQPRVS